MSRSRSMMQTASNQTLMRRIKPQSSLAVYRATLSALAGLVETRDPEAGDHLGRIRHYCRHITDHLNRALRDDRRIPRNYSKLVVEASTLHDIGKAAIPDRILLKPDRLTPREFDHIRAHTIAGYRTLMNIRRRVGHHPFLRIASEITYCHHERWDGSGYPRGLAGKRIPLSARIVAIADVFDALVSRRCYKDPIPVGIARQMIERSAGTHFDPFIVEAFLNASPKLEAIATPCSK